MDKKNIEYKKLDIPFHLSMFIVYTFAGLFFATVGLVLLYNFKKLWAMGFVITVVAYFLPSIIGADLVSSFKEKYNIIHLRNRKRFLIFIINLFLGLTIIGWLISLFMACWPGKVDASVEVVKTTRKDHDQMKVFKILWYVLWSIGYVMLWFNFLNPLEWGKKRNVAKTGREWKSRHFLAPVYTLAVLFLMWYFYSGTFISGL